MQRSRGRARLASDVHRQAILSNIPDQAWLKDSESRYVAVNEAYAKACGLPEERILGRLPQDIWQASIAEQYLATDRKVLATGARQRFEEERPDRHGRLRCYETIKTPVRNRSGRIIGTAGISRDITRRKKLESDLRKSRGQLRSLSAHLHSVREEERARLSRELHDELGQDLAALRLGLDWLEGQLLAGQGSLAAKVSALRELTDTTIATMARIAVELRPIILDDLGLAVAAEWLVERVAKQAGLDSTLRVGLGVEPASRQVGITVFRILQEALTNIVRHAGASRVSVALSEVAGDILLEVEDDGRGFSPSARRRQSPALGLLGMKERAVAVGGDVAIDSAAGRGTRVVLRVPRRHGAARGAGRGA